MKIHALTVDAYALQHPGTGLRTTTPIDQCPPHLVSLYACFNNLCELEALAKIKQHISQYKASFSWLESPAKMPAMGISDILAASISDQHIRHVTQ